MLKYLLLLILLLGALPTYTQTADPGSGKSMPSAKVIKSFENTHISQIFNFLEKQYHSDFLYSDEINNIVIDNYIVYDIPLKENLDNLITGRELKLIEYQDNKYIIKKSVSFNQHIVKGVIKDEKGMPLPGATIRISELKIGNTSSSDGSFSLPVYGSGKYKLEISYLGFETFIKEINTEEENYSNLDITLKTTTFLIGGIEVIAEKSIFNRDIFNKFNINRGEIEHYQALSLKDILDFVPGNQSSSSYDLNKVSQISIRGDDDDKISSFGTLVLIDGVPFNNNAYMQFEKMNLSGTAINAGLDLRVVPADNIEYVEIMPGLPSVRYGDFISGIVNVQTRTTPSPQRIKIKNNPGSNELNFGGGVSIDKSTLSYNLNLARSEREIRITGDEYYRLTLQSVFSKKYLTDKLTTNSKVLIQTVLDEEEPKGDIYKYKSYNRDYSVSLSSWGSYNFSDDISAFEYNIYASLKRENSMKSHLVQSDRIINGQIESAYLGKVENKGLQWLLGGKFEYSKKFYTGDYSHSFIAGFDPQIYLNTGEGILIDSNFNYYGPYSGRRSYNFDKLPGLYLMNFYAEDQFSGNYLLDFTLLAGFRYELYNPQNFNLKGLWGDGDLIKSKYGSFFNPRLLLLLYLYENVQLRIGTGVSSKVPSLSTISPEKQVLTRRDPDTRQIIYYNFDTSDPSLKGFKELKNDISLDFSLSKKVAFGISSYYKRRTGEPEITYIPYFYSNGTSTFYLDNYNYYKNVGYTITQGIEFSFRTSRIDVLNMDFNIACSYNRIKNKTNDFNYNPNPDTSKGISHNYLVQTSNGYILLGYQYPASETFMERLQLNYHIRYICKPLELWATLRIDQLAFEKIKYLKYSGEDYNKLNEFEKKDYDFKRRTLIYPNKFVFNLSISKSLFKGSEVSFYVNNFLNDLAVFHKQVNYSTYIDEIRNPEISYGLEFSMIIDEFFN